jgi:protein TonB
MVPPYWKSWLFDETSVQIRPIPRTSESGDIIYDFNDSTHLGARLVPPEAISRADPIYTESARLAKWRGTVKGWMIVDKEGHARVEGIFQPAGWGLDEPFVQNLEQWKFSPALLDGSPVSMRLKVEAHFSMR